ncbi:MAG: OmpA family protein [Rickettsiales bacterium]|nr:OmpA family protein [Rickettsiales bacterium]
MADDRDIFETASAQHINEEDQWISLSDLMTGLMLIFMLIAIAYMVKVESQATKAKQVSVMYDEVRQEIYEELMREFGKDLPVWDAEITKDLAVRFRNPGILFDTGKAELKPQFQKILVDFFPRYTRIITAAKYDGTIQEVRIEGHTSSLWNISVSPEEAYFNNMELSQTRTRTALRFVLGLPDVAEQTTWLRKHVTANGLSSSHPILKADGSEDVERSQRVEFHIRTDADAWMNTIKDSLK